MYALTPLPYATDALQPHISQETLEYHYGIHHRSYVVQLNKLLEGKAEALLSLEEVVKTASGAVFNNAAQVWNHRFYWQCLTPGGGGEPDGALAKAINGNFGSFARFKEKFTDSALNNFGSSWTWLVKQDDGSLVIVNTSNAHTPLTDDTVEALLAVDLWEHAYYIDYRNQRDKYLEAFWALVNWEFVRNNLA
ncbi:MAG: Fe-Mn family superoxide dismutase [Pseudohongiellaceae bacterium]